VILKNGRNPIAHQRTMEQNAVSIAERAQALTLVELGHSVVDIHIHTGLGIQTIYDIRARVIKWGYDPVINRAFNNFLLTNDPESGQPMRINKDLWYEQ
jgi:hypothetical protein